ncbi:MarR family winged helix-turn-helix transcriptional regulator [Streptomyces sp. NBC_01214]|uniref:MarR family winged helix-turn-helix transcriptional regulator n=1 Tax=Streptomyces sp. NBC_01214 TaxID=2903777 RepID=UPI0022517790|nr:MarR family winged helix-turn-helix transcriptional regulator [Streptomyces sp. NBC_01214]MCX4804288.1 MarR family winged helix-turn-helix transcriptional regulator [Streptomyces sp. NBC_01214]
MSGVERTNDEPPVGFLLYEVIRSLWPLHRTVVRAVERELMGTGMTAGQHAVIDELRRGGPRTVPQLARLLGLDRQPVQRLVNDATALGLAESAPNPEHRRSHLIRLTPKGEATISSIQEAEEAELRRRLADLSAGDVATALKVLRRLGEEFKELAQDAPPHPTDRGDDTP